jgi:hypothetical protein
MKSNARSMFLAFSFMVAFALSLLLLSNFSAIAQGYTQIIPRIETVTGNPNNVPPSYRLVISRPQDIVFVFCPSNYAPKLGYLRNVEAVQCARS